ncbi:ATP-binding protein [Streptomyces noursei]|uniref:ATP-binding protein n=1 Tax=Streptomyces noursei TaxID=1971 RepID=UPI001962A5EC|nr:ATP-binding protein [Streptomyces noursei]QRX95194.1 AAA family ATPase [Streptomyces noursei]
MPKNPPESMQHHLRQRLNAHAAGRWPQLARVHVRFRTGFAYLDGELKDGERVPLCRLRFTGVLHTWGFALYQAGNDSYRDGILPSGLPAGSAEEALDRAGDLYLKPHAPGGSGPARVPAGLVLLVGPPASGKTSFVRALIARGQIDEDAVVSSDVIRAELFGTSPTDADSDAADARIFEERDRRIVARLAAGHTALAESTNVTPQARARLIAIARRFNAPVTMLRFPPDLGALLQQHAERDRTDITAADVRAYAAVMARHAGTDQLHAEGAHAVHDVPGRHQGATPAEAAAHFSFT